MTGDDTQDRGAGETFRLLFRPFVAAAFTGRSDQAPAHRPWPPGLRWTRRIGIGRLPLGAVAQVVDLGIAVAILFGSYSVLQTEADQVEPGYSNPSLFFSIALGAAVPLALRQRHPLGAWRIIALVAVFGTSQVQRWMTTPYLPGMAIAALLILYSVAVRCPRHVTIGVGLISVTGTWMLSAETAGGASAVILLPLLAGFVVRQRQTARQELLEREEAAQRELAEQERRHQATEVVLTERQRIARELHDVVAHHMSMIAIQAEAAPYKVTELPAETRQDLSEIRATALDALTELRRILGVLRQEDGAETAPQPSLDRLEELVAGARGAGLSVTVTETGDRRHVPPGYELTIYRIVQEALSNAMRHAPGSTVVVAIDFAAEALRVSVVNEPPPGGRRPQEPPPGGGHGLVGMRERAAMLGGELTAGPTLAGGFEVDATLPTRRR
ncbi:sensor histidine kinase [Actinomadura rudentiformis]|uniref:histidine kinase n=1 Tax=Actinomadura rudentiformis TaxID=359158 RepID=A0A6H9YJX3_9ACTN|nr:sensor histidine kinase [Actinomadura rudentiformis]KAB2346508.1 sensor histidine kinase [Actinomadura rudentiformis]